MKIIALLTLFFALYISLSIEPRYQPTALLTPQLLKHFPKYIAHRSLVSGKFKENTMNAVEDALKSDVKGIEIDVRLSKDGILFLYHDDTFGHGKPEDYTWEQLKCTKLEDVLKRVGSKKFIFLDIKTDKIFNTVFVSKLIYLIRHYRLQKTLFVESFNPFFLMHVRFAAPDILIAYDFIDGVGLSFFQKQMCRIIKPDMLETQFDSNPHHLKKLINLGYPMMVWTVDDLKTAQKLLKMGVKGIKTNTLSQQNLP